MKTRAKTKISWKPLLPLLSLAITIAASAAWAHDGEHAAPKPSNASFEQLKALAGEWEADGPGGSKMHEQITLTGGNAVLMENMFPGTDHAMITMYHPDGKNLMATHYCAAGNQPRMRSSGLSADGKTLAFNFVDATHLKAGESHMHHIEIHLLDANHYDATWTSKGSQPEPPMTFHWTRVASTASAAQ